MTDRVNCQHPLIRYYLPIATATSTTCDSFALIDGSEVLSCSRYVGISSTMTTTKTYHQPALTSVAHPPRSRANEGSKTKRERDTSVHGCPRGVPLLPVFPPFFSSVSRLPSRLPCPAVSLPPACCPLSLSLSPFLSLSNPALLFPPLSLSPSNPLYPRRGSFLPLGSPGEIGHRTTLDELPTSPRRVPVPPAKRSAAFGSRARVNHFSGRVIKTRGGRNERRTSASFLFVVASVRSAFFLSPLLPLSLNPTLGYPLSSLLDIFFSYNFVEQVEEISLRSFMSS